MEILITVAITGLVCLFYGVIVEPLARFIQWYLDQKEERDERL